MALELLLAVPAPSRFRFDGSLLAALAPRVWPGAEEVSAQGQVADVVAWICAVSRPPREDQVLLVNWAHDLVPLTPDLNSADLLRRR